MVAKRPIPAEFVRKKQKILDSLAIPDADYTDKSPKGSVDKGIIGIIGDINGIEGLITTSSCAGRVSVFLEGSKSDPISLGPEDDGILRSETLQTIVPGGKGRGGRWLFVSHDLVGRSSESVLEGLQGGFFARLFGIGSKRDASEISDTTRTRFVKFQFEPMILHIMAASLHHGKSVLSAAINAGFRESGVQSLKNLEDSASFPMVAVRSSGLALTSIIGFMNDGDDGTNIHGLVDENYLNMLILMANERFRANTDRIRRFRDQLMNTKSQPGHTWENADTRRARLRAQGLQQQQANMIATADCSISISGTKSKQNSNIDLVRRTVQSNEATRNEKDTIH